MDQNSPDQDQQVQNQQPAIQQQRDAPNPVVAVTGPALQAIIQNAVQAGVAAYAQHAGQATLPPTACRMEMLPGSTVSTVA